MATQVATLVSPKSSKSSTNFGVGESLWAVALRRFRRDTLSVVALVTLIIIAMLCFGAPIIAQTIHIDVDHTSVDEAYSPPGVNGHFLGTDNLGRDQFIRLLYGGQVSLSIGFFAGVLSLTIGVFFGIITGFQGGLFDDLMIFVITTLDSIPSLYLILLITVIINTSKTSQVQDQSILTLISPTTMLILILSFLSWTGTMRLVRGETLSLREREYVVAARSIGVSDMRIMFGHIMPNVLSVILVTLAISIGNLILVETALSYLSFGVQPPTPSWGNMLSNAQEFFRLGPHLVWAPGILIVITVLCLYVLGDGLRDAFDPKLKEKG